MPDGTKIWLNAGSSIEYPILFEKNTRKINIKGEAYVEVKHNPNQPFIINVNDHFKVLDIGTSFNISAYSDEPDETVTLIEGEVSIENNILRISQKFQRDRDGKIKIQNLTDPLDEIAWTKGLLNFSGIGYASLFKKITRWYNVPIVTIGNLPSNHISGNIPQNMPLTNLLKILSNYELVFNYKNDTIYVSKK